MKHSKLQQHSYKDKELIPPFLQGDIGKIIKLHSWSKDRMPEYLWIGLLRKSVDRNTFFEKMWHLKEYILNKYTEYIGKFSTILKLPDKDKEELFDKIKYFFGDNILDPLIVVSHFDSQLRNAFYNKNNTNGNRIKEI